MSEFSRTTCQFGSHTVADVMMSHRESSANAPAPAVWVSAPLPLSLDEVAALVAMSLPDGRDVAPGAMPIDAVRLFVAELVCGGGAEMVTRAVSEIEEFRRSSDWDATYWHNCLRLARAVVAPAAAVVPAPRALVSGGAR